MVGMTQTPEIDSVRTRSFGSAAADHDMYRPRHPDQLVDNILICR